MKTAMQELIDKITPLCDSVTESGKLMTAVKALATFHLLAEERQIKGAWYDGWTSNEDQSAIAYYEELYGKKQ